MRALHRAFALSIVVSLAPSLVPAQQADIPRELALALIPYGGTDGGEIIVGQIPPDLATTFTLPAGGRILGTLVKRLRDGGLRWGVAAICIGVGQGLAVVLENEDA